MSATLVRRDFVKRSRVDANCPVHGSMTVYCAIDDEPPVVTSYLRWHADCEGIV